MCAACDAAAARSAAARRLSEALRGALPGARFVGDVATVDPVIPPEMAEILNQLSEKEAKP